MTGRRMIALVLAGALSLALAGAADAGGLRMGGGFGRGGRGGFHKGFHGGHFKNRGGFHARVSCMNHTCVTVYSVGAVFPSSGDGPQFLSLEYETPPPEAPPPAPAPQTQMEIAPAIPRDACYRGGCYHLQGNGVTVPYVWAWVPAPPPPPPAPVVLQYFNGRYEQRGDGITSASRWVWIPNAPEAEPAAPAEPPASGGPRPAAPVPSHYGQLYRWVDERGTVHWTQDLNAVPQRYRPESSRGSSG